MEKSSSSSENIIMSIALEMKSSIVRLAGPRGDADTKESMIARAARKARISYRQAKSFYYGESTNPRVVAVERVRAALAGLSNTRGITNHADQLESAALRLETIDPDFHREAIDSLRNAARVIRGAAAGNGGV